MPTSPGPETFSTLELLDVVLGVLLDVLLDVVEVRAVRVPVELLVSVVLVGVLLVGVGLERVLVDGAVVTVVTVGLGVGEASWEVLGRLVTGVSGMRVPGNDDPAAEVCAAPELTGSSPGTVTGGRVALGGRVVRAAPEAVAADDGDVADCPTALPQAASSRTVIP